MAFGSRGKNVELRDQDLCNSPINFVERGQLEIFPKNSGRAPTVQDPIAVEI